MHAPRNYRFDFGYARAGITIGRINAPLVQSSDWGGAGPKSVRGSVSGSAAPDGVTSNQATDYATSARLSVERPTFRRFATYLPGFASVAQSCAQRWRGRPSAVLALSPFTLFYLCPSFPPFTLAPPLPRDRCSSLPPVGILRLAENPDHTLKK